MRLLQRASVFVLLVAAFAIAASTPSPKIDVPSLPTERNQFGGRPGTFHFVTNEQTMADARALQQAFAALDRLDHRLGTLKPSVRNDFDNDLATLRSFAQQVYAKNTGNAGETAAMVEQRLNGAKGNRMCGACHGHGMMHGGGMGHRGGGQGRQIQ